MKTYSKSSIKTLRQTVNAQIKLTTQAIYGNNVDIAEHIKQETVNARTKALNHKLEHPYLKDVEPMLSDKDYTAAVAAYTPEQRGQFWAWRRLNTRIVLLQAIQDNKKSIPFLVRDTLENLVKGMVYNDSPTVTLSQLVHDSKLQADEIKLNAIVTKEISHWGVDEIRLQLISELAELNFIDIRIEKKTHIVSMPAELRDIVAREDWESMAAKAKIVQRKTILTEPDEVRTKNMISQSSWWYKTPELSKDQVKFITIMNNLEFNFVDNAENLIEARFKDHLKVNELPEWAKSRVQEYKDQIAASNENGGHYISGSFDSALRWYWQAEIGHNQTSEAIRTLVIPKGIKNPVKYDMTNNVVQMYALGLKSKNLAKYVSLVTDEECVGDLREIISERLNKALFVENFTKDNIKPLFMVWAYNAGKNRLLDGVVKEQVNFFTGQTEIVKKAPGLRELSGNKPDDTVWSIWNSTMSELVPEIVELKKVINNLIKKNPLVETSWVMPDGAVAQYASVDTINKPLHWVTSTLHQHQHTHYRKQLVVDAKAAGLLPRKIHSMDAYVMRTLVLRAHAEGIIIVPNHDSFMFDEEYTERVFELVRELLIEIMDTDLLHDLVKQYNKVNAPIVGEWVERELLTAEDILVSTPMKPE